MDFIKELSKKHPELLPCEEDIYACVDAVCDMYEAKGTLLMCGNGGSAADCSHIAGELMKGFLLKRPPTSEETDRLRSQNELVDHAEKFQRGIRAISLVEQSALISAFANDVDPELVYAQSVFALGKREDLFLGISTSGNSKNVVLAAATAKALGLKTIAFTGEKDSKLSAICDITVKVPSSETFEVQQYHLPLYHAVCAEVEKRLFKSNK
ncbi:MAG: SIS domain-containing protein [Clostridia bacterium]|nr:SIS domain-containing protein [Clostridia bacterium]